MENASIINIPMKVQSEKAFSTVPYSLTDQLDDSWWKPILFPEEMALPTVIWAVSIESKSKKIHVMKNNGNYPLVLITKCMNQFYVEKYFLPFVAFGVPVITKESVIPFSERYFSNRLIST